MVRRSNSIPLNLGQRLWSLSSTTSSFFFFFFKFLGRASQGEVVLMWQLGRHAIWSVLASVFKLEWLRRSKAFFLGRVKVPPCLVSFWKCCDGSPAFDEDPTVEAAPSEPSFFRGLRTSWCPIHHSLVACVFVCLSVRHMGTQFQTHLVSMHVYSLSHVAVSPSCQCRVEMGQELRIPHSTLHSL